MKVYAGKRHERAAIVTVTDEKGTRGLSPRLDLRNHSPDGFEWGYRGSGPSQLALALCADVLGDDRRAEKIYQRVKEELIAPIKTDEWAFNELQVRAAIDVAEGR